MPDPFYDLPELPSIFSYLAVLLIVLNISIHCGRYLSSTLRIQVNPDFKSLFVQALIGVLFLSWLCANFFSSGLTALNLLLIPFLIAFYNRPSLKVTLPKFPWTQFSMACIFALGAFIFGYFHFFKFGDHTLITPHSDYLFYAEFAQFLRDTGFENYFLNDVSCLKKGLTPYHYQELWLTILFQTINDGPAIWNLLLQAYPLLISILCLGGLAIIEQFSKLQSIHFAIAICVGCMSTIFPFYDDGGAIYKVSFHENAFNYSKLAIVYCFFIWALLLIKQQAYRRLLVILSALCVLYPVVIPGIVISIGCLTPLYVIWSRQSQSFISRKQIADWLKLITPLVISIFSFFVFYKILGLRSESTFSAPSINYYFSASFSSKLYFTVYAYTKGYLLGSIPYGFVVLYIAFIKRKKINVGKSFLTISAIYFGCMSTWMLFSFMEDNAQLFMVVFVPLFSVFLFELCIMFWFKNGIGIKVIVAGLFILNLWQALSFGRTDNILTQLETSPQNNFEYPVPNLKDINHIKKFIKPEKAIKWVSFHPDEYYKSLTSTITPRPKILNDLQYFSLFIKGYAPTVLTYQGIAQIGSSEENLIQLKRESQSLFNRFVKHQKINQQFQSLARSRRDFILEHEISYGVVGQGFELSLAVKSLVKDSIVLSSGQTLLRF